MIHDVGYTELELLVLVHNRTTGLKVLEQGRDLKRLHWILFLLSPIQVSMCAE